MNSIALLTHRPDIFGFVRLFGLEYENNLPTWFQSIALLSCSAMLAIISVSDNRELRWASHWRVLSILFLYLSLDEVASIHELLVRPIQLLINPSGFLLYGWVIPAIVIVSLLFLKYVKFLSHLPSQTKRLFLLAGAVYIGGAVGMEMIGGYIDTLLGRDNFVYLLSTTIEESAEMLGILVFIHALLSYMSLYTEAVQIHVQGKAH